MQVSPRAFLNRLATYPVLLLIMPLYGVVTYKKPVLDAFYFVRGFPHGFLKGNLRVALYGGLQMAFPFDEDPSFDDVWLRNVYCPYFPESDDTVIDVGAHMGFFTLRVARNVGRVVAVEPDPGNFQFLVSNVRLNELEKKVVLRNLALGERNGKVFLDRGGYGYGRSKTSVERTDCPVEMRRLDDLVQEIGLEKVDLIKIDTEGNELGVLKGSIQTLEKFRPDLLLAAYHDPDEYMSLANYLREHHYRVFYYEVPLFLSFGREVYLYAKWKA